MNDEDSVDPAELLRLVDQSQPVAEHLARTLVELKVSLLDAVVALRMVRNYTVGQGFRVSDVDALEDVLDRYFPPPDVSAKAADAQKLAALIMREAKA